MRSDTGSQRRLETVEALSPSAVSSPLTEILGGMSVDTGHQVAYIGAVSARPPVYASPRRPLPPRLTKALEALGIDRLYSHQVAALELARKGQDVVVVTSTSSGKTLCYNLPILERILSDRAAHALYIYPINALVNDQFNALARINLELGHQAVGMDRYSGGVTTDKRREIRARQPNILLTNPEMLHLSLLQWHHLWAPLWKSLAYIVLDEVHSYRGVFGSHIAGLMRRTLRVAQAYGASPQFICCSATIANPQQLVQRLTSRPATLVDEDGSASGRRVFVMWNPPLAAEGEQNVRRSYADESVDLFRLCLQANLNTIVFTRARRITEQMLRKSQDLAAATADEGDETRSDIASYRAGYLADEREEIEARLKAGALRGVITTNALELGIDIGGLDSAIIAGYPGSIMSTWQQAGRAGRRGRDALVFLVASQNPLDQYYMLNPEQFFDEPHEQAVVDLENPYVRLRHLLCSAREVPFANEAASDQNEGIGRDLSALLAAGLLEEQDRDGHPSLTYPGEDTRKSIHMLLSLRSTGQETYTIRDEERHVIGTIQPPNVFREAHPGAIYQHGDEDLRVVALNIRERTVTVRPEPMPHYTRSLSASSISVSREIRQRSLGEGSVGVRVHLGEVEVTEVVSAYQELEMRSGRLVRRVNLDSPLRIRLHTTGLWIAPGPSLEAAMPGLSSEEQHSALESGLHAVQHLFEGLIPLLVMCDRRDIGGESSAGHPDTGGAALFLYDACEGGIGLAEAAFEQLEQLFRLALVSLNGCSCSEGCPACIQSSTCRRGNEQLNKDAARRILEHLVRCSGAAESERLQRRQTTMALNRGLGRAIEEIDEATRKHGLREHVQAAQSEPESVLQSPRYSVGDWVLHSVYGQGIVIETDGTGQATWVTVRFKRRSLIHRISAGSPQLRPRS